MDRKIYRAALAMSVMSSFSTMAMAWYFVHAAGPLAR